MIEIPAEFAWIEPGVKFYNKKYLTKGEIRKAPNWNHVFGCWEAKTDNGLSVFCHSIAPINEMPITLTITRKQAEALLAGNCPSDVYDQLKEQLK